MFAQILLAVLVLAITACDQGELLAPNSTHSTQTPAIPFPPLHPTLPLITIWRRDTTCASGTLVPIEPAAGYGRFNAGAPDWHTPDTLGDYRYLGDRRGGVGNTLEYLACGGQNFVWLDWEWEGLRVVAVRAPWKGQTDRGLRVGDDADTFHKLYPTAHHPIEPFPGYFAFSKDFDVWDIGPLRVVLQSGKVSMIQIDWYTGAADSLSSTRVGIGPVATGCPSEIMWYCW